VNPVWAVLRCETAAVRVRAGVPWSLMRFPERLGERGRLNHNPAPKCQRQGKGPALQSALKISAPPLAAIDTRGRPLLTLAQPSLPSSRKINPERPLLFPRPHKGLGPSAVLTDRAQQRFGRAAGPERGLLQKTQLVDSLVGIRYRRLPTV